MVEAVDGGGGIVGVGGAAGVVVVRLGSDRRPVAGGVGGQRLAELGPVRLGVEGVEQRVVELPGAGHAATAGRRRCCRRGGEQGQQRGGGIAGRAPRTGRAGGAPGEERVEDTFEAVGLPGVIWSKDRAGSITLSSTMARMWVGKSAA